MSASSVVLVTGASRAIGHDIASALLRSGHQVAASMRGPDGRNAEAAAALRETGAFVVELDVNVLGVQRVLRAVLPTMRAHRSGLIVQLSSGMGRYAMPARGPYTVSKFALEAMSDTYRVELTQFGIEVVVLELGPFRSSFQEMHVATTDAARQAEYPNLVNEAEHDARHRTGWGKRAEPTSVVTAVEKPVPGRMGHGRGGSCCIRCGSSSTRTTPSWSRCSGTCSPPGPTRRSCRPPRRDRRRPPPIGRPVPPCGTAAGRDPVASVACGR